MRAIDACLWPAVLFFFSVSPPVGLGVGLPTMVASDCVCCHYRKGVGSIIPTFLGKRWWVTIRREQARSHFALGREGKTGRGAYSGCLAGCGMGAGGVQRQGQWKTADSGGIVYFF